MKTVSTKGKSSWEASLNLAIYKAKVETETDIEHSVARTDVSDIVLKVLIIFVTPSTSSALCVPGTKCAVLQCTVLY